MLAFKRVEEDENLCGHDSLNVWIVEQNFSSIFQMIEEREFSITIF